MGLTLEQFVKTAAMGRICAGKSHEGLYPMGGAGGGEECGEEGAAETNRYELTKTPIPLLPVLLGLGGGRRVGMKLSPGRREGRRADAFRFGFISLCPTLLNWQHIKLIFLDLSVLILTQGLFAVFFSPCRFE